MGKLSLNINKVEAARKSARSIAESVQEFIDRYTTVSVERSVCRLLGIDGVDSAGVPLPNTVVERLRENGNLGSGAARFVCGAMLETGLTAQAAAQAVARGEIDINEYGSADPVQVEETAFDLAGKALDRIRGNRTQREKLLVKYGDKDGPYLYVIVATGNIYEDITQAEAAARQGADIIAVIRSTGQSLLDYVPYGATSEGFGGTYATQENFRLMRAALDQVGAELGRYIRLCNYCSGLCMPEIAVMGALERLDVMLNDALYGILFRDINMKRTFIDQYFSRMVNAYAGVIINTGEDNYLTTADAFEEAHTVLASQFINEQFALKAGLPEEQIGLGHAFEMDPQIENAFVYELAQAQMARDIFPKEPLKYMPPTKFMTGDIFRGQVQDTLFNIVTALTGQKIHLLGMMTEAIHTPFMSDRSVSIENASYIFRTMKSLGDELNYKPGGIIQQRADDVLGKALSLLRKIETEGMFTSLEKGTFAGVRRGRDNGKGLDGVAEKDGNYLNPFIGMLEHANARMQGGATL